MRELIGRGSFSRAYKTGENSVELVSVCPAKTCYATFSKGNPFAPIMEHHETKPNTFKMPLYPHINPRVHLNQRAYLIYRELSILGTYDVGYEEFCSAINESHVLTETEKENIISLASDVCNAIDPDDLRFEIPLANITCDEQGNLIMLDCFFSLEALRNVRYGDLELILT